MKANPACITVVSEDNRNYWESMTNTTEVMHLPNNHQQNSLLMISVVNTDSYHFYSLSSSEGQILVKWFSCQTSLDHVNYRWPWPIHRYRSTIGQLLADYRLIVDRWLTYTWPILPAYLASTWRILHKQLIATYGLSCIGQLLVVHQSTIGQLSADRLAEATYSTHDPRLLHMKCSSE